MKKIRLKKRGSNKSINLIGVAALFRRNTLNIAVVVVVVSFIVFLRAII